ncbi:MAG: NAD(P)-dependent glycerol-3-phosphate dehydrogenase [Rubrivivax sp.]|nr:NAD(P)-dependent glycerol-3-phosphate dehydrogenase [Rubrivivax sp.]
MKIAVLGAGAWGTAIAIAAAARHEVLLWARDAVQAEAMRRQRRNLRYLPEVALPPLKVVADASAAHAHAREGLLIVATPMAGLREQLRAVPAGQSVVWLSKGFEAGTGALGHEIARDEMAGGAPRLPVGGTAGIPQRKAPDETPGQAPDQAPDQALDDLPRPAACGVLSGPSFALEVARGQPTALVAASADAALAARVVGALHGDALRVYSSSDVVGVEVGGAVKNVLAIAVGALDGLKLGLNARAALVTRGLAEMTRLGVAMGAQPATFMGLSGLGDLVLTATGDLSRNRRVGMLLAEGLALPDALARLGHVAEGVPSAPMVLARARRLGVEMPITACVVDLLDGRTTVREAVARLMARDARAE